VDGRGRTPAGGVVRGLHHDGRWSTVAACRIAGLGCHGLVGEPRTPARCPARTLVRYPATVCLSWSQMPLRLHVRTRARADISREPPFKPVGGSIARERRRDEFVFEFRTGGGADTASPHRASAHQRRLVHSRSQCAVAE
jgi:hypothetical protein